MATLLLAGNRPVPSLLFVTSRHVLDLLGEEREAALRARIPADRLVVLESVPASASQAMETTIRPALPANLAIDGVVLVGGYDQIPSERVDALAFVKGLRNSISSDIESDPDRFIVWNDDIYGNLSGNDQGQAEVPVSRIPSESGDFVWTALQAAGKPMAQGRCGIRNEDRPYADGIYAKLPGVPCIRVSGSQSLTTADLDADRVYLALHGNEKDRSKFWGADPVTPALDVATIQHGSGAVIFAGCCWSALSVDRTAVAVQALMGFGMNASFTIRTASESIPLKFIEMGATAYIGFTGSHYPPPGNESTTFSGPLHRYFWRNYNVRHMQPAEALFQAKARYLMEIPHGNLDVNKLKACELKAFWSVTCLGLGW